MSLDPHIDALKTKHAGLDKAIKAEERRPIPNSFTLQTLKRAKLRLKDEITLASNSHPSPQS